MNKEPQASNQAEADQTEQAFNSIQTFPKVVKTGQKWAFGPLPTRCNPHGCSLLAVSPEYIQENDKRGASA